MNLPFVFGNPWGALALLGLPAVVLIHCLQQKSRILKISTLFLLERLAPDSKQGRRLTWLRSSLAFWLQILCVLLVTWMLLEPRWLQADSVQRVVLVLDSSMSMRAFTGDLPARVSPKLKSLAALTPRTYWTLIETDPTRPTLYEGLDLGALKKKLPSWSPSLPAHDPTHALDLARAIAPREATVIFITDRPHDVPSGVDLLAIGEPLENCGLVGSRVQGDGDDLQWQIMVQNYGQKAAHRTWWLEIAGEKTEPQSLDLEPGHAQMLKGKFPPKIDRLEVCLEPDRFTVDDRMAVVRPAPKRMTLDLLGDDSTIELFTRLARTIPGLATVQSGEQADIAFMTLNPTALFPGNAISSVILFNRADDKDAFEGGPFAMDDDPLMQDLNWQGLIIQPVQPYPKTEQDRVLLWKDGAPVIFVRSSPGDRRQLVFNFNFATSNATRLPAFVLLISRFVESVRLDKKAPETRNAELAEPLTLAAANSGADVVLHNPDGSDISTPARAILTLRAPSLPGFFTITQGGETLLTGAAQFADARESDFKSATTTDTLANHQAKLVEQHTEADSAAPLWLILIGILLVIYWAAASPRLK